MMKARIGAALLVGLVALPAVAYAQEANREGGEDRDRVERQTQTVPQFRFRDDGAVEVPLGPRATEPRFGDYTIEPEVESRFSASADEVAVMRPPSGKATALMIAGAALLVAGLIIEDDAGTLVAVAGAAVGAYGVYLYFS
jgi:hypothetical protein